MRVNTSAALVVALAASLSGLGCETNAAPPPAAAEPAVLPLAAGDPAGTPAPNGAPALFTSVLKFRIPSGTVFEVAEDGWLLGESNATQCGDDGCYAVLGRSDDGAGQTTYVIQTWPQAYRRFGNRLKYLITDVSLNNTLTGEELASKPATLLISPAAGPVLGGNPLPAAVPGTPEWAADNEVDALAFATIGLSSAQDAAAYYAAVDPPPSRRATFEDWRDVNGFARTDDSLDTTKAYYFNAGDLRLGRAMHMSVKAGGDIAYYVSNFPTANDAIRGTNLIATVAMEYAPIAPGGPRVMKFFVYTPDGQRALAADLDGNGAKFVPNLCIICHGNTRFVAGGSGDVGARFLPFDLSSFQYGQLAGRPGQEAAFKELNAGILDRSNRSAATAALIEKWYEDPAQALPNRALASQNDAAVPAGWIAHDPLYLDVVRPACRSCHVSRDPGKDFGSFNDFNARGFTAFSFLCSTRTMPNAKVNHERFWLTHLSQQAGGSMVGAINAAGVNGWTGAPCPQ